MGVVSTVRTQEAERGSDEEGKLDDDEKKKSDAYD